MRVPLEPREVVPLAPAPIGRADGSRKNACARNAAKRRRRAGRRAPPPLKRVVVEAAVAANGPPLRRLPALDRRFVLGVKPGAQAEVFPGVAAVLAPRGGETQGADGGRRRDRLLNGGPLNAATCDLAVNCPEGGATTPKGRARHFSWGTDIESTASNGEALRRAGRARGRLENEPFNPLKHHGSGVAHHVGPGTRPRAPGFAGWTRLAVSIDQLPPRGGARFGAARERAGRPQSCWARRRRVVLACFMPGGEARSRASACGHHPPALAPFDTSCPHRRGRVGDERVLQGHSVAQPLIRRQPEGEPSPTDPPTGHPPQNAAPSAPQNGLAGLAAGSVIFPDRPSPPASAYRRSRRTLSPSSRSSSVRRRASSMAARAFAGISASNFPSTTSPLPARSLGTTFVPSRFQTSGGTTPARRNRTGAAALRGSFSFPDSCTAVGPGVGGGGVSAAGAGCGPGAPAATLADQAARQPRPALRCDRGLCSRLDRRPTPRAGPAGRRQDRRADGRREARHRPRLHKRRNRPCFGRGRTALRFDCKLSGYGAGLDGRPPALCPMEAARQERVGEVQHGQGNT